MNYTKIAIEEYFGKEHRLAHAPLKSLGKTRQRIISFAVDMMKFTRKRDAEREEFLRKR